MDIIIAFLCLALGTFLFWRLMMSFTKKARRPSAYEGEVSKYYDNMKELGYSEWQTAELLKDYTTYEELQKANKSMEKALNKTKT